MIEVNYKTSRVLLLSDLNSSVPISIIPGNIQAIINGDGKNSGEIKYIKDDLIEDIEDQRLQCCTRKPTRVRFPNIL